MGLDMYAYKINAKLVDDNQQTDVQVYKAARRAVGFLDLSDDELRQMPDDDVRAYWSKRNDADEKAKAEGFFDSDFAYWRKFNALHGWMSDLYYAKGGTSEDFNCNTVRLTLDDLAKLEEATDKKSLEPRRGFFWGGEEIFDEEWDSLREFIKNARAAISEGYAVFYDSWW